MRKVSTTGHLSGREQVRSPDPCAYNSSRLARIGTGRVPPRSRTEGFFERSTAEARCGASASRRTRSGTWSRVGCEKAGLKHIAPHDLRRTCAKLCHSNGGELEQIQFLLGHASVQTTERYLGCKQNLGHPVNDRFCLGTGLLAA